MKLYVHSNTTDPSANTASAQGSGTEGESLSPEQLPTIATTANTELARGSGTEGETPSLEQFTTIALTANPESAQRSISEGNSHPTQQSITTGQTVQSVSEGGGSTARSSSFTTSGLLPSDDTLVKTNMSGIPLPEVQENTKTAVEMNSGSKESGASVSVVGVTEGDFRLNLEERVAQLEHIVNYYRRSVSHSNNVLMEIAERTKTKIHLEEMIETAASAVVAADFQFLFKFMGEQHAVGNSFGVECIALKDAEKMSVERIELESYVEDMITILLWYSFNVCCDKVAVLPFLLKHTTGDETGQQLRAMFQPAMNHLIERRQNINTVLAVVCDSLGHHSIVVADALEGNEDGVRRPFSAVCIHGLADGDKRKDHQDLVLHLCKEPFEKIFGSRMYLNHLQMSGGGSIVERYTSGASFTGNAEFLKHMGPADTGDFSALQCTANLVKMLNADKNHDVGDDVVASVTEIAKDYVNHMSKSSDVIIQNKLHFYSLREVAAILLRQSVIDKFILPSYPSVSDRDTSILVDEFDILLKAEEVYSRRCRHALVAHCLSELSVSSNVRDDTSASVSRKRRKGKQVGNRSS